jgi:predicted butyrate kinase (DUF1464 family)
MPVIFLILRSAICFFCENTDEDKHKIIDRISTRNMIFLFKDKVKDVKIKFCFLVRISYSEQLLKTKNKIYFYAFIQNNNAVGLLRKYIKSIKIKQ